MPGPFMSQKPHDDPSMSRRRLVSSLNKDFKDNEVSIFALTRDEFIGLWIAVQKARNKTQKEIEKYLSELTGLDIAQVSLANAAIYGPALKTLPAFTAILLDFKRSGNILGKYEYVMRNGKRYVLFKGNHKLRTILKSSLYLVNNTQVVSAGIGSRAIKIGAKSGLFISLAFSVTLNTISWIFDDEYRWTNWLATTATDVVKVLIGAIAAIIVGVGLFAFGVTSVVITVVGGLIIGVGVSVGLNILDEKSQVTKALITYLEQKEVVVQREIDILTDKIMTKIGEEMHQVYLVTTNVISKYIQIKIKKETSKLLDGLKSPW